MTWICSSAEPPAFHLHTSCLTDGLLQVVLAAAPPRLALPVGAAHMALAGSQASAPAQAVAQVWALPVATRVQAVQCGVPLQVGFAAMAAAIST